MIPNLNQSPGNTPLNEEELAGIIPALAAREELNEWERKNILEANEWALNPRVLKRHDPLIEPYLRELHRRMFNRTWKWAGRYRKSNKNLDVPFHQIMNNLAALLGDTHNWLDHDTFDLDEIAVRFHHRLVSVHAFSNGNGRHARLVADVIVVKNGRERFTWGARTLMDAGPTRAEYIRCLQAADADNNDTHGLVNFARS